MENNQKLLTLYIPIYNRSKYLTRMLSVFLEDSEMFENTIELIVSDNCSSEDIQGICENYKSEGLNVHYHRNSTNIGGDANIRQGFLTATSKYVWVLGSDDIPVSGFLKDMIPLLEERDYGLFHINHRTDDSRELKLYDNPDKLLGIICTDTTFISMNIVATEFVAKVDLNHYANTCFAQTPLYLSACTSGKINAIYEYHWMQMDNHPNNDIDGGYNVFEVFFSQFLNIFEEHVDSGIISHRMFAKIKKKAFKDFFHLIWRFLIKKKSTNRGVASGWKIIFKYYGHNPYYYLLFIWYCVVHAFHDLSTLLGSTSNKSWFSV